MSNFERKSPSGKRRVLLIGWDAADWKVIDPLVDAGKMPNLARLIERGVVGNLATLQPALSPMLWTSIATGKRPYQHGILGFSEPDPQTGAVRPVTNLSRKTKAVWNILNQNDLNTITVGWWPSHPAEPLSRGVMVSNSYQSARGRPIEDWPMAEGTVHPPRLAERLKELRFHPAELIEEDLRPFLPGLDEMTREELDKAAASPRLKSLMKIIADCTTIHSAATALMQNEPWDLMCVYYDAIDHFGHAFMKFHPPQRPGVDDFDFRLFNHVVEAGYRYHDMMLGTLLDLAGEEVTVILMSDHGFHPDDLRLHSVPREPAGPAAEHRQFGILAAMGPGLRRDERVYGAGLLDLCPTLLHLFGLPAGEDMPGKVLHGLFENPAEESRIPSWDAVDGDHGMHPADTRISAEDSAAALQQLVGLGYIEDPGEDQAQAVERTVRELKFNLAQSYIDGGIYTEAAALLEELAEQWPMEHRFGFRLATCYRALGRPAELRRVVTTVIERREREAGEALAELKALGLEDPQAREREREHFESLDAAEQQRFAKERETLIAKARPNLFSLRYLEATADLAENQPEAALEKLARLDSEFGARRTALELRGEVLQRLRRWDEAREAFQEALGLEPENPGPLLGLARTELAARRFDEAADHARASVGLLYFQPRAHYLLGVALHRAGRWQEAETALQVAVKQTPLAAPALRLLAEIARKHHADPLVAQKWRLQLHAARQQAAELRRRRIEGVRQSLPTADEQPLPPLDPRSGSLDDVPEDNIVTLVTGLPRSGTSLMMQLVAAAGIPLFTDGRRSADDSNQRGYHEHQKVAALLSDSDRTWLRDTPGRALKVVAPLLAALPPRPPAEGARYRVIFMERDMDEVLESQSTMLDRLGKPTASTGDVAATYRQQLRHARNWLNAHGIPALAVDHRTLVHDPERVLPQLAAFLGRPDRLAEMREVIDPALHRARRPLPSL